MRTVRKSVNEIREELILFKYLDSEIAKHMSDKEIIKEADRWSLDFEKCIVDRSDIVENDRLKIKEIHFRQGLALYPEGQANYELIVLDDGRARITTKNPCRFLFTEEKEENFSKVISKEETTDLCLSLFNSGALNWLPCMYAPFILDGDEWALSVVFVDGNEINKVGGNMDPENFDEVVDILYSYADNAH